MKLEAAFERRARANGRTFEQEIEMLLEAQGDSSRPEERVAVSALFSVAAMPEIQPSLTLDEIREGFDVSDFVVDASVAVKWFVLRNCLSG